MGLEDKTKKVTLNGIEVTTVISPLTKEEAREMFSYRPLRYSESRFGGNTLGDDFALLLNGFAKRCSMCQAPTKLKYLNPYCPDCDGRSASGSL
ncbi:MAG: hypothetical protein Q7S06_02155 [Nanoarchaeota archaeon]|nr:hypothetical protein [Nanoarchaeota archaeon]